MPYTVSDKELQEIINDYDSIAAFVKKYKSINYFQFDNYIVSKISLFLVHENIDFDEIKATLDKIEKALPSIVHIFERPIIHLKEAEEILPVEMVNKISNETLNHATTHSELWDNITNSGVRPKKLLTKNYEDNYSIYENQLFVQTVNDVLDYFRRNLIYIKSLMFTTKNLDYNILERVNHLNYYLAIGKLQTGYIRNFDEYYSTARELNSRISHLFDAIHSRTKYKVYKKNSHLRKRLPLKTTNILQMQKDYHKVFVLARQLNNVKPAAVEIEDKDKKKFNESYFYYCIILLLFSLSHLNFSTDADAVVDFKNLNNDFTFKKWVLNVSVTTCGGQKCILLTFSKQKTNKILVVPNKIAAGDETFETDCDETVHLSPSPNDTDAEYVSISDIDSFRRLQQIILRGMLYCDTLHRECPFCKGSLQPTGGNLRQWSCSNCKTRITHHKCDITAKQYFYTDIEDLVVGSIGEKHRWLYGLQTSELMYYRNITKITEDGEVICPHCGRTHQK